MPRASCCTSSAAAPGGEGAVFEDQVEPAHVAALQREERPALEFAYLKRLYDVVLPEFPCNSVANTS